MTRGAPALLLILASCVAANPTSLGAHGAGGGTGDSAVASSTTSMASTSSGAPISATTRALPPAQTSSGDSSSAAASEAGEPAVPPVRGWDGSTCELDSDCVERDPCQDVACELGRCLVSFHDDRCASGQMCSLAGCDPELVACDELYPDAIVCDDFERGLDARWTNSSLAELASSTPHTGSIAARAFAPVGQHRSTVTVALDEPRLDGSVYLRSYLFLPVGSVTEPWAIVYELMQLPPTPDDRFSVDLKSDEGVRLVNKVGDESPDIDAVMPRGRWVCIELGIELDDTQGAARVWVDDALVLEVSPSDTLPDEGLSFFGVGLTSAYESLDELELFIDDVVFATERVGCER